MQFGKVGNIVGFYVFRIFKPFMMQNLESRNRSIANVGQRLVRGANGN